MKRRTGQSRVARLGLAAFAFVVVAGIQNAGAGGYYMPITFRGYTNRAETLANFPVLVVLSNNVGSGSTPFAYSQCLSTNGWDLRFRDVADASDLNYEIESWNTNGASHVWVQVPTLAGDGTGSILAKWGNPAFTNQLLCTTNGATWSTAYRGVWHFTGTNAAGKLPDSTVNRFDGTNIATTDAAGVAGRARSFNGTTANINVTGVTDAGTTHTLEYWLSWTSTTLDRRYTDIELGRLIMIVNQATAGKVSYYDNAFETEVGSGLNNGAWHHVVYVLNGAASKGAIYVDGAAAATNIAYSPKAIGGAVRLGSRFSGDDYFYAGLMDEARFSSVARSSNWVWACWMNQASNTAFASCGNVQTSGMPPTWSGVGVSNVTTTAAMGYATLGTTNADVYLFWDTTDKGQTITAWANTNFYNAGVNTGLVSGVILSNLTGGASYTCRFYGTNTTSGIEGWSAPNTFITGEITVTATVATVSEAGPGSGQFTVYRPAGLTNGPLTVTLSCNGTAMGAGVDYASWASTNSVTIPAGTSSVTIAVTPIDDGLVEGNETVALTVQAGGYIVGSAKSATVTILDDEPQPADYTRKARIVLGGYDRSESLTNFPLLVALSTTSVAGFAYDQVLSSTGNDVRFFTDDLSRSLNYEIEKWDVASNSYFWVQVPELRNNAAIWVYWGNVAAAAAPLPCTTNGSTWDSSYKLVWHLKESGNGTTGEFADATANKRHGRGGAGASGQTPTQTAGKIGLANAFDQTDDFIQITGGLSIASGADFTFEAWLKPQSWVGGNPGIWRAGINSDEGMFNIFQGSTGRPWIRWNNNQILQPGSGYALSTGDWVHVAYVVKSAATAAFCANGDPKHTATHTVATPAFSIYNIGYQSSLGERIQGAYDEIRISTMARSTNWIWAEWMNVASNQSFASYGAAQDVVAGAPDIANIGAVNITADGADLVGNLKAGGSVTTTCYWGTNDGLFVTSAWMTNTTTPASATAPCYVTNHVTGLVSGHVYTFRYYATNNLGDAWAIYPTTFSTLGPPTVDNDGGATAVGQTSAQLRGTLLGGNPDPTVWFYWGTADGGTTQANWNMPPIPMGQPGLASFGTVVSGLDANRTYWYRCFASNSYDTSWAPASTNFTTTAPTVVIGDTGLLEGALGATTTAVFTVTLSAASALPVSVDWGTADGTALASDGDYVATNGTLTIPAGQLTGSVSVSAVGDNVYELTQIFYVNLGNAVNSAIADNQGAGTITNDDWTVYVRGDGDGSDGNSGGSWSSAWATLGKALSTAPLASGSRSQMSLSVPFQICVQASTGAQAYDVAARNGTGALNLDFEGGWENVAGVSTQTGISVVKDLDGTVDEAGISLRGAYHNHWRRVVVNRFAFTNVTRGVEVISDATVDSADVLLFISNATIRAQNTGIFLDYPKSYSWDAEGGRCRVNAENVDIVAGLGGPGDGIYSHGAWLGSSVTASGMDPATGAPRVSTITSTNGCGVRLQHASWNTSVGGVLLANTVIYQCASNGVSLNPDVFSWVDVNGSHTNAPPSVPTFWHCTIADNGGHGVYAMAWLPGGSGNATNSLFANNRGHGLYLDNQGYPGAFACAEAYNTFFNDDILTNGTVKAFAATTSTADPVFYGRGVKPNPWYMLGARSSPAYHSGSDGENRGAYLQEPILVTGTMLLFF